jgi:hypothetical protein
MSKKCTHFFGPLCTMRCALCDMFMGYRTTLSYEYNPSAIFTKQELALPPRTSSVYSIWKPDMCRQVTG